MAFELLVDFPFFFSKSRSANPSSAIASPICSGATAVELAHAAKAAPDGQRNKKMPEIDATKEKQNEIKQIGNPSEEKKTLGRCPVATTQRLEQRHFCFSVFVCRSFGSIFCWPEVFLVLFFFFGFLVSPKFLFVAATAVSL